ncbi:hypothetical protein K2X33_07115, partial [bacterium]|nr:hypothetical protein [bacterium]
MKLGLSLAMALVSSQAFSQNAGWEDPNTPKLEIRQYRFGHHGKGNFDRLVLEFDRKDEGAAQPKITVQNADGETNITLDNAYLMGAIPESLINDSYAKRSHFLGPITVGMDAPSTGFSLRVGQKGHSQVEAQWLTNPSRLVIDARGAGTHVAANTKAHAEPVARETLSIGRSAKYPGLADLMCFPATAKVGLTVIFKPQTAQAEEVQNFRINTDGINPQEGTPAADAIVCYPKRTQIQAALSFETHTGYFTTGSQPETASHSAEAAPVHTPAPATASNIPPLPLPKTASAPVTPLPVGNGHEDDLDPGLRPWAWPRVIADMPGIAAVLR